MYPELIIFNIAIPMYPLCVASGFLIGMIISDLISHNFNLSKNDSFTLMCFIEVGVIIGGKLLYLLINIPNLNLLIAMFGVRGLLTKTGFVFYGGLIGAVATTCIFSGVFKKNLYNCLSLGFCITPLIHAFGRIGCFCSGCCYGRLWNGVLAIYLKNEYRFPVQLLESCLNILLFLFLFFLMLNKRSKYIIFAYLFSYGIIRVVCENFRGDIKRGFIRNLSISTWISILCIIIGIYGILRIKKHNNEQIT